MPRPPKDGMLTRFCNQAMPEIRALVPDFANQKEANDFFNHFMSLKRFKDVALEHLESRLPERVTIGRRAYRCTTHVKLGMADLTLLTDRANPMEILHTLAHYVQPSDSAWHRGEFGAIFLSFIERQYDAEMKRKAGDIMHNHGLKTFARSEDSRHRQSLAYHAKKAKDVPMQLAQIMEDMDRLRGGHGG